MNTFDAPAEAALADFRSETARVVAEYVAEPLAAVVLVDDRYEPPVTYLTTLNHEPAGWRVNGGGSMGGRHWASTSPDGSRGTVAIGVHTTADVKELHVEIVGATFRVPADDGYAVLVVGGVPPPEADVRCAYRMQDNAGRG